MAASPDSTLDATPHGHRSNRHGTRVIGFLRLRWRPTVFGLITLWLCAAIAVVFVHELPNAERSGSAEELAAHYQQYLGSGWFPLEIAPLSTPPGWLGLNYSSGTVSTVRPAPSWRSLRLRLAPVGCAHGQSFSISVRQGNHILKTITPPAGWTWFTISLFEKAEPVTLHYSCVVVQPAPTGPQRAQLAVLLSGLTS